MWTDEIPPIIFPTKWFQLLIRNKSLQRCVVCSVPKDYQTSVIAHEDVVRLIWLFENRFYCPGIQFVILGDTEKIYNKYLFLSLISLSASLSLSLRHSLSLPPSFTASISLSLSITIICYFFVDNNNLLLHNDVLINNIRRHSERTQIQQVNIPPFSP